MKIYKLFLLTFILGSVLFAQSSKGIAAKIAETYGIENFKNVKSIQYTFNVQKGEKKVSRTWKWFPHQKKVISGTGVEYVRTSFNREDKELRKIDWQFINDNYWLLFPYHLQWDTGVEIEEKGDAVSPINNIKCSQINAVYKGDDGYTPNDIYELYLNSNFEIIEWVYRPGGSKDKVYPATWSSPEDFNGIKISLKHANKDGSFKLWFTDIKVELK